MEQLIGPAVLLTIGLLLLGYRHWSRRERHTVPVDAGEAERTFETSEGPFVIRAPADVLDQIQFIRLPSEEEARRARLREALPLLHEQLRFDLDKSNYWRGDRQADLRVADLWLGSLADWVGLDWDYLPDPTDEEVAVHTIAHAASIDHNDVALSDPTHGQIDEDIQTYVAEMEPASLGQRVAIQRTLQDKREDGDLVLGVNVRCSGCGKVASRGWRKTDEWANSRMCATCLFGVAGAGTS